MPQAGHGSPVRARNAHASSPRARWVPNPSGLGTSHAAVTSTARHAPATPAANTRPAHGTGAAAARRA